ncbi:LPXTG cell wall anchor domain-containing protein [Lacticaseibacillus yichunensis]|uniref:LPXTG cell wall anchor domain-containing protein n=1 Tax=Lacticaseibacillus yichunensis TaxID=2486015 RepID=A0ABW4CKK2_9LACO|nr:LPXTG cell wall anchor domain-containing protein [Lacticaseibacillus yichunensis]
MIQEAKYIAASHLGGMFMYAVDRDGRTYSKDDLNHVYPTSYRWTKTAIALTKGYTLNQIKAAALQHISRVANSKGWDEETVTKTRTSVNAATSIFEVYSAFMSDDYEQSVDPTFDAIKEIENPLADKTALETARAAAEKLVEKSIDPAALKTAITNAETVDADEWATQNAVDAATVALNTAIKHATDALAAKAKADEAAGFKVGKRDGEAGKSSAAKTDVVLKQPAAYQTGYANGYKLGADSYAAAQKALADKKDTAGAQPTQKLAKPTVTPTPMKKARTKTLATKTPAKKIVDSQLPATGDLVNTGLIMLGTVLLMTVGILVVIRKRRA